MMRAQRLQITDQLLQNANQRLKDARATAGFLEHGHTIDELCAHHPTCADGCSDYTPAAP